MTIGSSPFLTADADETSCFNAHWSAEQGWSMTGDCVSARLELIRRRVLTGYYSSPSVVHELAQRIVELDAPPI
jgi:hypothetical protein